MTTESGQRRHYVKDKPLFLSGLMFAAIGALVLVLVRDYPMGKASNMGPGYFPAALALLLCCIGLLSVVLSIKSAKQQDIPEWPALPAIAIAAGVLAFGLLVTKFGLVIASTVLLLILSYNRITTRPIEFILLTIGLVAFASFLFVKALGIPLDLWP
ncbi:tripartite tricarboxylate transporter TctB [Terrihabitans soli]|uniref:Tripartite tricarboxylate transporter TctB n=1 Tax=Terrihabitans soli TaxID=708113 RepID=A0A6S6QL46_9HYPH|nr:tripartite tricarboxylate transporter TctB family protein [Terrihabitans soli]BCJ89599.1 tripartite tricarboxylate transporter TctB [Terrihabitans soli]